MGTTTEEQKVYYVDAIGVAATRIGRAIISPNMPPVEVTEEEYEKHKKKFDFYVEHGVISVAHPGSREAILKADAINRETARLEAIFAGEDEGEPDPVLRERGFSVSEEYAEKKIASRNRSTVPTFTAPAEHEEDSEPSYKCLALAKSGERCKIDALEDLLVCAIHQRMLRKGTEVKDANGHNIATDGKSLEG